MKSLVCGAGGFIGSHLARRLKAEGHEVLGADLKYPEFSATVCDHFYIGDLREQSFVRTLFKHGPFDEIYQLAADMGGAGFVFTGENDADILHNSAMINLNMLEAALASKCRRIFYSSSACIYPERNQLDPQNPVCTEESAYPAAPDSEYGWEKLFSERVYAAFQKNYGIQTRIGRYHNIYGPEGTYDGGREKAPAAMCRKVALAKDTDKIDVWGTGEQTRSFLYIDECVEGTIRLMRSDYSSPVNIGSTEMVSINELVDIVAGVARKKISKNHVPGPRGVMGRNSDNTLIEKVLGWTPREDLRSGIASTYAWIAGQLLSKS